MKNFLVVFVVCMFMRASAQDTIGVASGQPAGHGGGFRKAVATGMVGGILVGSLVSSYFDWWVDSSHPFHFLHEGMFNDVYLGIDKVGHAYTSYFYFHTFRNIMLWGGYEPSTALWWALGTSGFFAVSIEVGDGLSPFGFSFEDLSMNMLGLGYGVLQTQIPFLQNFKLKWSYVPREGYRFPPHFAEHYDAHTYWLTVNVHELLPASIQDYWPSFLQLAVGYGVDDTNTRREAVIGLDFNLSVFSTSNDDLRLVRDTADLIHLPAPAVKFVQKKSPQYLLFHLN